MFMLREGLKMDSPDKLKDLITDQCGDAVIKRNLEIGYFRRSKKIWLNNRLDMNDFWELILKERVLPCGALRQPSIRENALNLMLVRMSIERDPKNEREVE